MDSFHLIQPQDIGCKYNSNPNPYTFFTSPPDNNYRPDSTTSPLTDSGSAALQPQLDLYDFDRVAGRPITGTAHSIGAIEWHQ